MNTSKLYSIIFLCSLWMTSMAQVQFLNGENWAEAQELAAQTNRPIFIDFYTTWCGPCKKMDKTTFVDSTVSNLMSTEFINLKLDAELEINKELVQHYEIKSYPTFVFANADGSLISKESGYKDPTEFEKVCQQLISFVDEDINNNLTSDQLDKLSDEELSNILTNYVNYNFDSKKKLKSKYYDKIKRGDTISLDGINFLMSNLEANDPYILAIEALPKSMLIYDKSRWEFHTYNHFKKIFKQSITENDWSAFELVSHNYRLAYEKISSSKKL